MREEEEEDYDADRGSCRSMEPIKVIDDADRGQ